jgi:hypothetical protein
VVQGLQAVEHKALPAVGHSKHASASLFDFFDKFIIHVATRIDPGHELFRQQCEVFQEADAVLGIGSKKAEGNHTNPGHGFNRQPPARLWASGCSGLHARSQLPFPD